MKWRCAAGHVWKASPDNVRNRGSWCPQCSKKKKKLTIEDMCDMAIAKGGVCLSEVYVSSAEKLRWRCKVGHEFSLSPNNIRRAEDGRRKASWCPSCATSERLRKKEGVKAGVEVGAL